MRTKSTSQSGIFTPRIVVAFALCSCGVLLGMFSLAATPLSEVAGRNTTAPPTLFRPDQVATGFASEANALPPGVPLPPGMASSPRDPRGAPFSVNGQGDPSRSSPTAGFAVMPLRPGTASGANSLGNPVSANQQPAPLSVPQPAASESMPLASAAAGPDWSIVASANALRAQTNILIGVTCVSTSDCWAVGYFHTGFLLQTLIERWDGTSWAIVTSPNTSAAQNNLLAGVTCMSASECWAIGYYNAGSANQTLIERWNGTAWTIVTSPNTSPTQASFLQAVTCASGSDCWAVGYSVNASGFPQTLIERWNGTSWAIVTSPNTSTAQNNLLTGVTCASASDCWAVGYYNAVGSSAQTLVERWDGTSWVIVSSPNTSATLTNDLLGVTCVSVTDCWAVGYSANAGGFSQTLIERWNGASWAIVTSPNASTAQNNALYGVTCASASDCWAVDYYKSGTAYQTLIERWDGTSWAVVSSPNTSATLTNQLLGVTCVSASDCWAVGHSNTGTATNPLDQTLIERWNGTSWAIVTSPNALGAQTNLLYGVTCASASDCWAVGYSSDRVSQTVIERWDGTSWTIVTSPNSGTLPNALNGVACVSASDCWAVGYSQIGFANQTLVERWDGTSWTLVTSPNTSSTKTNFLNGVTCASATNCWAVGYSQIPAPIPQTGDIVQTLIERWDGTSWTIVTSPNTLPTQNNLLNGVTCASATDCWAVGYTQTRVLTQVLIERWDGTSWAIVSSPKNTSATLTNDLFGVTCVSASDCWAVGYSANANGFSQTLIERWNGASWAIVTSPNTSAAQDNYLYGVACASASDCWAVGYSNTGTATNPLYQTLIERWNGTSWAIVTSPNSSTAQNNLLLGVTCVSTSDCWAVGAYNAGTGVLQTLTEHYGVPSVQLVNVVSRKPHGSAGTFDINLPLTGTRGVECRSGGTNGNYTMVFTFLNPVTNCGSVSTGAVTSGPNLNQCTVNLTGVTNAQYITVTLADAVDSTGATGNVSGTMGVLTGDVNATGLVDGNDVSAVQGQARQTANSTNFRLDVNTTGLIDGNDVSLVQSQTRSSLPTPP